MNLIAIVSDDKKFEICIKNGESYSMYYGKKQRHILKSNETYLIHYYQEDFEIPELASFQIPFSWYDSETENKAKLGIFIKYKVFYGDDDFLSIQSRLVREGGLEFCEKCKSKYPNTLLANICARGIVQAMNTACIFLSDKERMIIKSLI